MKRFALVAFLLAWTLTVDGASVAGNVRTIAFTIRNETGQVVESTSRDFPSTFTKAQVYQSLGHYLHQKKYPPAPAPTGAITLSDILTVD